MTPAWRDLLIKTYAAFNARDIDAALLAMHQNVEWPNGMEGGYVHGHDGIRAYWTRQWTMLDPHVEPVRMELDADGRVVVEVHQVVRDLSGTILVDRMVHHLYTMRDGLVITMAIEDPVAPHA
jgi:ketosteroid isomerase-like protein